MPILDVSELLSDPMFVERITVIRREQVVNSKGRTEIVPTVFENVIASMQPKDTAIGGNAISREADGSYRGANMNVYTKFRLRSVSKTEAGDIQFQPDIIVWNGDHFLVALVNDWTHYGRGWMHAEIESIDPVDNAPDGAA